MVIRRRIFMNENFANYLIEFISKARNQYPKLLLFFKGFNSDFYRLLHSLELPTLHDGQALFENGYIDSEHLHKNANSLLVKFLMLGNENEKFHWGFYEELISLLHNLQDLPEKFDGKIMVVDNNLFEGYYFIGLPEEKRMKLNEMFKKEKISEEEDSESYSYFYSDTIEYPTQSEIAISYINKHQEENIEEVGFYTKTPIEVMEKDIPNKTTCHIHDSYFQIYKNNVQSFEPSKDLVIQIESRKEQARLEYLQTLLKIVGNSLTVQYINRFDDIDIGAKDQHVGTLKKYWGDSSQFRDIVIYKNPDLNNETIKISQGNLINSIIEQSMKSKKILSGEFRDIFITAPTGSGKSVLFQIPAIYLAEKNKLVTIVITPLLALMRDQVENLQQKNGVEISTYINSEVTFQEREERLAGIRNGDYSIVYISPELFLANSIESLVGNREIGLLVVDEAHLVTTWGRDFRADYWYLGSYINKIRRMDIPQFPILCLTATAVYQGEDDIVNETISSLNLRNAILYLGNVRRDNIEFDILPMPDPEVGMSVEEYKELLTAKRVSELSANGHKSLVYCPYTRQVDDIYEKLDPSYKSRVRKYYGSLEKQEKNNAYQLYKSGQVDSMICTKAFGMGVDISDIEIIYHHAPTGYLPDYLQEIGRAARKDSIRGIAKMDYSGKDMKYVKMLNGMSGIKNYQLQEMIRKIYQIYKEKDKRSLLISSDAFSYLFPEKDIENRVKNALMLISKDFEERFTFPVINVRPKSMYTKNFVNVPKELENQFTNKFASYVNPVTDHFARELPTANRLNSPIVITTNGTIYEVDMGGIWENHYTHLTFPQFKRDFFNGELVKFAGDKQITARAKINMYYSLEYDQLSIKMNSYLTNLTQVFSYFKNQGSYFTKNEFKDKFKSVMKLDFKNNDISSLILDLFIANISENVGFNQNSDRMKFIQSRKSQKGMEQEYRIMNSNFTSIPGIYTRVMSQCKANINPRLFSTYIPFNKNGKMNDVFKLAIILELFELASYEVIGGKNMEIFIRINDPSKLRNAAEKNYRNLLVSRINERRKYSEKVFIQFLKSNLTTYQRWNLIEDYFLGYDEKVADMLGIE